MMAMWRAHDGMGWWMAFGGLLWLLFWASVIYLIVTLVGRSRTESPQPGPGDPLEIATRRYASGEITREQFEQLRDDLAGHHPGGSRTNLTHGR
jgi:putative membrane protein